MTNKLPADWRQRMCMLLRWLRRWKAAVGPYILWGETARAMGVRDVRLGFGHYPPANENSGDAA